MSLRTEWKAIDGRIKGLVAAADLYLRCRAIRNTDVYDAAGRQLLPEANRVYETLRAFRASNDTWLPESVRVALDRFLNDNAQHFDNKLEPIGAIQFLISALAAIGSEVTFHLADTEASRHRLVERAFPHLQRSIIADCEIRSKWQAAYGQGETACERLGAVHLLAHGIWAFKAHTPEERTDLVLGNPVASAVDIEAVSDALVLTEWKKVGERDLKAKAEQALRQAARYAGSVLGGVELRSFRYLVLVSNIDMQVLPNIHRDGITYRHICVSVAPGRPSDRPVQRGTS
jgi:hypothetical protein